jgi:hypothetical protein
VKQIWFPGSDTMTRVYLGTPILRHVTGTFVLDRLRLYLTDRTFLTLPFLFTLIWGWAIRNPLLPIGYVAALPWLALNFLAVQLTPGTLSYYYGFPFWLSLAWPLVALTVWRPREERSLWPMALILAASLVGSDRGRLVVYPLQPHYLGETPLAWNDYLSDRAQADIFAGWFRDHRAALGGIMVDQAVGGLLIEDIDQDVRSRNWEARDPDTMIYFERSYEWFTMFLPRLRAGAYGCVYTVLGTRMTIAARHPLDAAAMDPGLLAPVGRGC